jgi:poly(A) polymerase
MITLLNKLFSRSKNFNSLSLEFQKIKKETEIKKIFKIIEGFSSTSEIRYVGGCVRKVINNEVVDDIDLAVNLNPDEVLKIFKKNNIKFYEIGINHGTITALIDNKKFEITSLRKDVLTDGRHAKVEFSNDWHEDASRRDFTINAIYADIDGNLFDPFDGKKDLENGKIKFIGEADKRIKEDYLRILRYVRFFLNYSKKKHDLSIIKIIKQNLDGFNKISPERLLDEFKKLFYSHGFVKLTKDIFCSEIIKLIFPQFKNINIFKKLNNFAKENINNLDFVFLISLMIIDGSDNADYFIYKFNLSKKDQKRILFLNNFFSTTANNKIFSINNLRKILYFNGKQALLDLLYFQVFRSKKIDKKLINFIELFKDEETPLLPLKATTLIAKYNIPEGKELGVQLKKVEKKWINNNFEISDEEIQQIIKN